MKRIEDCNFIGQRFGLLTIAASAGTTLNQTRAWLCRCDCGEERIFSISDLRRVTAKQKSCGCLTKTAGDTRRTYICFRSMHTRCSNPNDPRRWKNYGGRGIKVCERWSGKHGFKNFLADMGINPAGLSLDRFPDNDGNYEKSNCRWATPIEQRRNQERKNS